MREGTRNWKMLRNLITEISSASPFRVQRRNIDWNIFLAIAIRVWAFLCLLEIDFTSELIESEEYDSRITA